LNEDYFFMFLALVVAILFAAYTSGNPTVREEVRKYSEFEDIPRDKNAHSLRGLIEVLQIINKYKRADICAEHDEVYLHTDEDVSMEDAKRLYELAAFYDYSEECWKKFV
jgi:hypothetical protein